MDHLQPLTEYLYQLVDYPGDVNEHLFTLLDYAKRCESTCELGVRDGISTAALALGLAKNGKAQRRLQANSATIDLPEVDLLFIDSWHCYGHLRRELAKHHSQVRKWIIMHDTNVYGRFGEAVRWQSDLIKVAEDSGYSIDDVYKGLNFAVAEFLAATPEWTIEAVHEHNHGLTILKRQDATH